MAARSRFSTSSVIDSEYLVPCSPPTTPPARDYFFRYGWILSGIPTGIVAPETRAGVTAFVISGVNPITEKQASANSLFIFATLDGTISDGIRQSEVLARRAPVSPISPRTDHRLAPHTPA